MWAWALLTTTLGVITGWWLVRGRVWIRLQRRETREDTLKYLITHDPQGLQGVPLEALAGYLKLPLPDVARLVDHLCREELVRLQGNRVFLTPRGRQQATRVVRAHRLWEVYLAYTTDLPEQDLHRLAEKQEHRLSPEELRDLADRLGHPRRDPHGDPIPDEAGNLLTLGTGQPLTDVADGQWVRVVHVEDEPTDIFAQIVAEGITPRTVLQVLENRPTGLRVRINGRDLWLAPILANNIGVQVLPAAPPRAPAWHRLADLEPGTWARVVHLSPRIRGLLRRRLLDLGFTPGARVKPVLKSAFGRGDPTAFWVRGSLIALRREQAREIFVSPEDDHATIPPSESRPSV